MWVKQETVNFGVQSIVWALGYIILATFLPNVICAERDLQFPQDLGWLLDTGFELIQDSDK